MEGQQAGGASGVGAAASTAAVSAAGSQGGGGGGGGQAEGGGEAASGEAQFLRLFEARFGLAAPSPPVAAADGVAGSAAAPPPPPFHLAHVPEPSPPQGIPQASPPAAHRMAVAAGGAAGDETECCVCTEGRKTHIFMPCRHMCVCAGCAPEIMYWGWALLGVLDGTGEGRKAPRAVASKLVVRAPSSACSCRRQWHPRSSRGLIDLEMPLNP